MKDLYDFALQLADQAGKNTLKYFRQSFEIETKEHASPVTIADRTTEELMRTEIEKTVAEIEQVLTLLRRHF